MWLDLTESVKAMRRMTQVLDEKVTLLFDSWPQHQSFLGFLAIGMPSRFGTTMRQFPEVNEWMSLWLLVPWRTSLHLQRPYSQIRSHDIHRSQVGVAFSAAQTWRIPESWFSKPVACISQWRLLGVWRRCSPPNSSWTCWIRTFILTDSDNLCVHYSVQSTGLHNHVSKQWWCL